MNTRKKESEMALKKCHECQQEISTAADKCPHCGAANMGMAKAVSIVIGFVLLLVVAVIFVFSGGDKGPPEMWVRLDKSPAKQEERRAMIDTLFEMRVFDRIDQPLDFPALYVDTAWHALKVADKETAAKVVLLYYFAENPDADLAYIKDGFTGQQLGTYDFSRGLRLK